VLSGILLEQESKIVDALGAHSFDSVDIQYAGEWICVVITK
jgi:ribosomal protein L11 methylase PrmA